MVKSLLKGVIYFNDDIKKISFRYYDEKSNQEKTLKLNISGFDNSNFDKYFNREVVIKIKTDWFFSIEEYELLEVYRFKDFQKDLFLKFAQNFRYYRKDNELNKYIKNPNNLLKEFDNDLNKKTENIFEWFLVKTNFSFEQKSLILHFAKNFLDFELLLKFTNNETLLEIEQYFFEFNKIIFNYLSSPRSYIDIVEYSTKINDFLISIDANFESIEIQAMYFMIKIFENCNNEGHIFINHNELEKIINKINKILKIEEILNFCLKSELLIIEEEKYYPYVNWYYEDRLALNLAFFSKNKNNDIINESYMEFLDHEFNHEQIQAVKKFAKNKISIITGGAGTGKTRVIKNIVEIYNYFYRNNKIMLCAPSGMAAYNIKNKFESLNFKGDININPTTIHKLLGGGLSNFWHNITNKLDCKLIIVDECSMINLRMYYSLIDAIPEDAKIVFVGDVNQLPPIGCGNIFENIIESKLFPVTELKQNMRQNKNNDISKLANLILNKKINSKEDFEEYVEVLNSNDIKMGFDLDEKTVYEKIVNEYKKNNDWLDVNNFKCQIISPINDFQKDELFSTEKLNKIITEKICGENKTSFIFPKNTRVFSTSNLYKTSSKLDHDIYNGQLAIVEKIEKYIGDDLFKTKITLKFNNQTVECLLGKNNHLFLEKNQEKEIFLKEAFSLSVHKTQGGEFDKIIYFAAGKNNQRGNFHSRKMIYTAITRAKKELLIFGNKDIFYKQLSTDTTEINSNLITKMKENLEIEKDIFNDKLAFISIKTTGLNEILDEIVAISIIYFKNGKIKNWDKIFKPKNYPKDFSILEKHDLTFLKLEENEYIEESSLEIQHILENKTLFSFNSEFDYKFLIKYLKNETVKKIKFRGLLELLRNKINLDSYKFESLIDYFQYDFKKRNSKNDVEFYKFLYEKLNNN